MSKRKLTGQVTSDKMNKTRVVTVTRTVRHPINGKVISRSKKYHAHDEHNASSLGDTVTIFESRPISKLKRFQLATIIQKSKTDDTTRE